VKGPSARQGSQEHPAQQHTMEMLIEQPGDLLKDYGIGKANGTEDAYQRASEA